MFYVLLKALSNPVDSVSSKQFILKVNFYKKETSKTF